MFRLPLIILIALLPWESFALDPKQVFDSVAPSTVVIDAVDTQGSGVVISDQGLILTNYHVVAANIGLKIRARVRFGNKIVVTEIDDVKLTKIHPTYDLALLEAKPPANGTFVAAHIVPREVPIATGSKCFAIGNPGGPDGKALELSITEGVVSSAARELDGLTYIQISAQINPGNSGGPVCDESGRVFGLTTLKMTETEGIGFAIPTQKISLADFVEPKAKAPNLALVKKVEPVALKLLDLSDDATGLERRGMLLKSAELFRLAMLAAPTSEAPYSNLCIVYQKLGQFDVARKYIEKAATIAPNDPNICHMLGGLTLKGDEQNKQLVAQCIDIWMRGLGSDGNRLQRGRCADDIGITLFNRQEWLGATYMLRWSEMLTFEALGRVDVSKRGDAWIQLRSVLPADQFGIVRNKKTGFSKSEFDALVNGKIKPADVSDEAVAARQAASTTKTTPKNSAGPATAPFESISPAQWDQLARSVNLAFNSKLAPVPEDGAEFPLPDVPKGAILANFGWQIVMWFPTLTKIGVFNLATGQFDGFLDCEDPEPLFAAGGSVLVVYLSKTQSFELYNLANLQKIASAGNNLPGPLAYIGLGALNPSRLFAVWLKTNSQGREVFTAASISLPDFKATPLTVEAVDGVDPLAAMTGFSPSPILGAMDDSGAACAISKSHESPSGLGIFNLRGGKSITLHYYFITPGYFSFSRAPGYLIGTARVANLADEKGLSNGPVAWIGDGSNFFAAIAGYPGYVERFREFEHGKQIHGFRIHGLPNSNVLSEFPIPKEKVRSLTMEPSRRLMFASAAADRIAYVVLDDKKLHLFPLGLRGGGVVAPVAKPGNRFERKVTVAAGSNVVVQSAPPGLLYDAKSNSLVWDVPANFKTGQSVQVILLVTPPGGKQTYDVEKIAIP